VVGQCAHIGLYVIDLKLVKQSSCNICAEDQDPAFLYVCKSILG
jgi:hypothetical protein